MLAWIIFLANGNKLDAAYWLKYASEPIRVTSNLWENAGCETFGNHWAVIAI